MNVSFPYLESLEKAGGSEKGWAINIAKLFSQLGHKIYFGNIPLEQGLFADIMYIPERIDLRPDQTDWNLYKDCARKFLFGVFNPRNSPFLHSVPNNSLLVTPYRDCGTECYVLPYAYYANRPEPGYARRTIGWTVRNPFYFSGSMGRNQHVNLYHLKACVQLIDDGCKFILFSNHTYPSGMPGLPVIINEAHTLLDELRSHPSVTVVDNLMYSDYIELLGQTSVVLPLEGLGSLTEALKLGSTPLSWSSPVNIYENFPNTHAYEVLNFETIQSKLSRLLTDEEYYNVEYNTLLDKAAVYDLETALKMVEVVVAA